MTMTSCTHCGKQWPSQLYADDCADQDVMEADDRAHGRFYGINRPAGAAE